MRLKYVGKTVVSLILILSMLMSSALAYDELAKGSKGDAVVALQERLNELGYSVGTADGDFGGKTEKAVKRYQQDNDIEATGIVDEITYNHIFGTSDSSTENDVTKSTLSAEQMAANCIMECMSMAKDPSSIQVHGIKYFKQEGCYVFVMDVTGANSLGGASRQNFACHVDFETGTATYNGTISEIPYDMYVGETVSVSAAMAWVTDNNNTSDTPTMNTFYNASVGDIVTFGSYEQDNNAANGQEPIEWIVWHKTDNRILLLSKYGLDAVPYHEKLEDVTWETCTLRTWLNNEFLNAAFTESELEFIPTVTVTADKNINYDTNPGNDTQDKIFLLGLEETLLYNSSNADRQCMPTEYALSNGAWQKDGICPWRLRTPGERQDYAVLVYTDGSVLDFGLEVNVIRDVVRPAMWITLDD